MNLRLLSGYCEVEYSYDSFCRCVGACHPSQEVYAKASFFPTVQGKPWDVYIVHLAETLQKPEDSSQYGLVKTV